MNVAVTYLTLGELADPDVIALAKGLIAYNIGLALGIAGLGQ